MQLTLNSSIFVLIRMQTARKLFRGTTADEASTLNQINVQAACYSQKAVFL